MSVYKPKNSPYYQYDFEIRGHRFHGTTKCASRREAEAVEREEKDKARRRIREQQNATVSLDLDSVCDRYWNEFGKHHAENDHTFRELGRVVDFFGPTKLITEITDSDIAKFVAWRRGHRNIRGKQVKPEDCPLIANGTVNLTTKLLRKIFNRAKKNWGVRLDREPKWPDHILSEPEERVRELVGDEAARLEAATRDDFRPFFEFLAVSGLRKREGFGLRWSEVNWATGQIVKLGKNGKRVVVPITPTISAILEPLQHHHPEFVFTYRAKYTRRNQVRGRRYPLNRNYINATWARLRKRAGVKDFRIHDLRHDFATKLLRQTRNLKLVQKALNHRNINSTLRYAHVLDDEVAKAMEELGRDRRSQQNQRTESRKISRTA